MIDKIINFGWNLIKAERILPVEIVLVGSGIARTVSAEIDFRAMMSRSRQKMSF